MRFARCLATEIAKEPGAFANSLEIFARHAPHDDARAIIMMIAASTASLPKPAHTKILGEAAWSLADVGDTEGAKQLALACAEHPDDGGGGRLSCFAVLGRVGAIADARKLDSGPMWLDAIGLGAAIGNRTAEAKQLRAELDKPALHALVELSAVHLKFIAALGDVATLRAALDKVAAVHTSSLVIEGAIVEGGARHHDDKVMLLGIAAIDASGANPSAIASALVGAAGTAAAAGSKAATADALRRFSALPVTARAGLELVPAIVHITLGDAATARKLAAEPIKTTDPVDREMFVAGLAAASGAWSELPAHVPPNAVLIADVWSRALVAKLDAATSARVLDAICPP